MTRLFEIEGNSEQIVFDKLKTILLILSTAASVQNQTPELQKLVQYQLNILRADRENLLTFVLSSERIARIYNEIKQYTR